MERECVRCVAPTRKDTAAIPINRGRTELELGKEIMTSKIAMKATRLVIGGLIGVAASASAFAQTSSFAQGLLDNPFVLNGGVFVLGSDVKGNLNGQSVNNPEIDFDNAFGKASDATRGRIDGLWRINPNHHVRFLYFDNSTTRNKVIDRDIAWGDYTFKVGGNVEAKNSVKVYELAYEYAFMRKPTYELNGSIGVHYMDMSVQLSGVATVTGSSGSATGQFTSKQGNVPAPLPVIGLRGGWVVAPQWYVDAQAQLFHINYQGIGGTWSDLRVGGTWMFSKYMGVGIGYNRFYTRVDVDKSDFNGGLKLGYSGLQAYLTGTF
jgi:hypothetical protein